MFKIVNDTEILTIEEMYEKYPNKTFVYREEPDDDNYLKGQVLCFTDTEDEDDSKALNDFYEKQACVGNPVSIAVSDYSNLTAKLVGIGVI